MALSDASDPFSTRVLSTDASNGETRTSFHFPTRFADAAGGAPSGFVAAILHGCVASSLDVALPGDQKGVTTAMTVTFLRSADPGSFEGRSRLVWRHGDLALVEATLVDAQGRTVASGTATARVFSPQDGPSIL
jgi:acyl-coenzyme A thioesterase PaaI-like protein